MTVRVRVPHRWQLRELHVRQLVDAEATFRAARPVGSNEVETWWETMIICHNPVTSYRFLLRGGMSGYQWLNGTGLHDRDVPDACDFRIVTFAPPPAWASGSVVYQIFPDRFARGTGSPPLAQLAPDWAIPAAWDEPVDIDPGHGPRQLYGGDLNGIAEHLDHLVALGITTIYLTPFFPGRSNHRYDASTFDAVDPLLGGEPALARLVDAAHARGIQVMGDLTANHTGAGHKWFLRAQADETSVERDFYLFDGSGDYVSWLGVPSLPKLNHASAALREAFFDAPDAPARRWLSGPHGLDGWRVDVANMTGRHGATDVNHEVAAHLRAVMDETAPGSLLIAEHTHDHALDAQGDGWHGVMNYSGFTRPVWTWLRDEKAAPNFLGSPLAVPLLDGQAVADTVDEFAALVPWRTRVHSLLLAGSHDTTRIRTLVGDDPRRVVTAAGLLMTMPGIPMLTYGDEIGMRGTTGEDGRRPMPWDTGDWDGELLEAYRKLIDARRTLVPLQRGGFRWVHVGRDVLCFVRETATESVLVHCARAEHEAVELSAALLPSVAEGRGVVGDTITVSGGTVTLCADQAGCAIWAWTSKRALPAG